MPDGVRIAIDVVVPKDLAPDQKIPAILTMTRYWRAKQGDGPSDVERFFASRGYAMISGDSRGTGASFGVWRYHRSPQETHDFCDIVSWIVAQPWSNGRVGAFGTSYAANTADWVAACNHPAIRAIIPRFPDFDPYAELYFPGGIFHLSFGQHWSEMVRNMDLNVKMGNPPRGIEPVDEDKDGNLLQQAVQQRVDVPAVYEGLKQITFRDDAPTTWGVSMSDWSIYTHLKDLERSGVAMYSWASWFDSGTANGVLERFFTLPNPQRAVIGPWSHGGMDHASPFQPAGTQTDPRRDLQMLESLCYFDYFLKSIPNGMSARTLIYYTTGEEKWKTTESWPPAGTTMKRLYLTAGHRLSATGPFSPSGTDRYVIDFEATSGTNNRWHTQAGQPVIYGDRRKEDSRLLTYTTRPVTNDLEITGNPVVSLFATSTASDGAFLVYLEDVAPDGKVTYLTEGELRVLHRKVSSDPPPYKFFAPYHSFLRKDASPVVPGQVFELRFGLLPISTLIMKHHRIRIAIAGADKGTFLRIPAQETPVVSFLRNNRYASFVQLPIVDRSH